MYVQTKECIFLYSQALFVKNFKNNFYLHIILYIIVLLRFEYGEMNITKLNQKIDNIEDEIYREKLKIQKCADEMGDTFDDMLAHY